MNFSRFFKYSLLFFLLCLLVKTARPINYNNSIINIGQPLIFEIPRISQPNPIFYSSLFVDKGNRLFITTDHDIYIYDGVNSQKIAIEGRPIISGDEKGRVLIGAENYLSLLSLNESGEYRLKHLIDSTSNSLFTQITGVGFDNDKIYFSTGSKLWVYNEKATLIDSSSQAATIYKMQNGSIFYTAEHGFYKIAGSTITPIGLKPNQTPIKVVSINDETIAISPVSPWFYTINDKKSSFLNRVIRSLGPNEIIQNVSVAGSYLFVSTSSNPLLMFDFSGTLIFRLDESNPSITSSPLEICTSDDINFFAITPTQLFRFINPKSIQLFNSKSNLKGKINETITFNNKLYIASSDGLYVLDDIGQGYHFNLMATGDFNSVINYSNNLYASGVNGLYFLNSNQLQKVGATSIKYQKTSLINSKPSKAIMQNDQGVFFVELNPPFLLNKIQNEQLPFDDYITTNTQLFLRTIDQKWYSYNFDLNKPQIISVDSLTVINKKLYKQDTSGLYTIIGRTFSGQPIFNYYSESNPNQQTLVIERNNQPNNRKENKKTLYSLSNSFEINFAHLDSDSCLWISTSQGLIRISADVFGYKKNASLVLSIFSILSCDGDLKHSLYSGIADVSSPPSTEYRIKHGSSLELVLSGTGNYSWNNLKYSLTISGSKSESKEWSINPRFLFNDLQPGSYTFTAKACDEFGHESKALTIGVKVVPNFFQTKFTQITLVIFLILSFITFYIWRNFNHALERFKLESIINRRTEELVKEKEKTDNLLARVLPRETATELKETGKVSTQKFNMATVLFSDIQGFTKITDDLNPESLIDQLDKFFLYFDSVVDKYKIEKIKTIGDAYMCAGGIPHKNRTNPVEVVLAALEMMYFMREINLEHNPGQDIWDLRIGIDTGPVIAGVVGRNKLTYDIWGTTVNTASRMESSGEVGKINISGNTHMLVQDYFQCTYRGKMPIKNKGDIEMYFIDGIKPALSTNLDCFKPNADFQIQLQFLRFGDLEEFILEKLEKGLPKNLYYHNLKHTVDVYTQVVLIGRSENISLEEQLLVQTAALLHDAGHLIDYDTHEEMGVKLAREILPEYLYSERQIEIISQLILITKLPPKPRNLLEAIMCDADLDYLGRTDFIPVSNMLYKELHEHGRIGTIQEWNELQIKFIEKHQYFTNTARRLRNVNKNSQLENIKRWIEKNKL